MTRSRFSTYCCLLKDAEIVCFFREEDEGHVRVSIKSKGQIVINKVAMELGGGGHEYAAGVALDMTMEKSVDTVIKRLETLVSTYEKFGK